MRFLTVLTLGLCLAGLAGLSGCAYRMGPTNGERAGARSVWVAPFENKTAEPRLVEPVTLAVRRQLQQDGTYRLETGGSGDILVTGTIVDFTRRSIAFQSRDALTPRDYRLTMTVRVIARERVTGRVLVDQEVKGRSDVRVGDDLVSAERQALPLVAADLARHTTAVLVDGSW